MATGDVYRLTIVARYRDNIYMNNYAFKWIGTGDPSNAQLTDLADDCKELGRPDQSNQVTYTEWRAVQLWGTGMATEPPDCKRTGGRAFAGAFTGTTAGGDNATDQLPPQCALVTTIVTEFAGRRRRGRIYFFGYGEPAQANGTWNPIITGQLQTRWVAFMGQYSDDGTSAEWRQGVWSEREASGCEYNPASGELENVDPPSPDTAFTPMVSVLVRTTVHTQRRRVLGVGR